MTTYVDLVGFRRDLTALGVEPPPAFTGAFELLQAAMQIATESPQALLAEQFAAGGLTAETVGPTVRAAALDLAAREHARNVIRDVEAPICKAAGAAVRAEGDRILDDLRPQFDRAAAAMSAAADLFDASAAPESVLGLGPAAAAAWRTLAENAAVLDKTNGVRCSMGVTFGFAPTKHRPAWFVAGIVTGQEMERAEDIFSGSTAAPGSRWHGLAASGFRLHLASAEETAATEQAVAADAERAAASRHEPTSLTDQQRIQAQREVRIRASMPAPTPWRHLGQTPA